MRLHVGEDSGRIWGESKKGGGGGAMELLQANPRIQKNLFVGEQGFRLVLHGNVHWQLYQIHVDNLNEFPSSLLFLFCICPNFCTTRINRSHTTYSTSLTREHLLRRIKKPRFVQRGWDNVHIASHPEIFTVKWAQVFLSMNPSTEIWFYSLLQ